MWLGGFWEVRVEKYFLFPSKPIVSLQVPTMKPTDFASKEHAIMP